MSDNITVTGVVATPPKELTVAGDLRITSFRLASGQRRFDKGQNRWVDGATNWYTVTAFRHLAVNAGHSLSKGDRVVASGRLRVRDWESGGKKGTSIDIEADSLGHDLAWGTSLFTRVPIGAPVPAEQLAVDQALAAQSLAQLQPAEPGFGGGTDGWATPGLTLAPAAGGDGSGGPGGDSGGDADDADDDSDAVAGLGSEWSADAEELQPMFRAADATPF